MVNMQQEVITETTPLKSIIKGREKVDQNVVLT
jgi:hypothetical protein